MTKISSDRQRKVAVSYQADEENSIFRAYVKLHIFQARGTTPLACNLRCFSEQRL